MASRRRQATQAALTQGGGRAHAYDAFTSWRSEAGVAGKWRANDTWSGGRGPVGRVAWVNADSARTSRQVEGKV